MADTSRAGIIEQINFKTLEHEFTVLRRRIESLEQSDVDIRHVLRSQEEGARETRRLLDWHQRELKELRDKQAEIDRLLLKFSDHLAGVIEP